MESPLHQAPLLSHHCLDIYFLYLSEKVIMYSVFLVFICFHPRVSLLVSFPSQAVHDPPATTTLHLSGCSSSCLGFCQRATPLVSILAGQICNLGTWQASQGQCHLSTPLCLAFYSSPPSQDKDLPPGQPVPLTRAWREGSRSFRQGGRGWRKSTHHFYSLRTSRPHSLQRGTVGEEARNKGTSLGIADCWSLLTDSLRADLSELQREQLYRTFEVDYFAHMRGTIASSFLITKMGKVE